MKNINKCGKRTEAPMHSLDEVVRERSLEQVRFKQGSEYREASSVKKYFSKHSWRQIGRRRRWGMGQGMSRFSRDLKIVASNDAAGFNG